jgi:hypothetical protein
VQHFKTQRQPLPGENYVAQKKNNTKYSGHFVPQEHPRAAHALRSDQLFEPWYQFGYICEAFFDIINSQ